MGLSLDEIIKARKSKLAKLKELNIVSYPENTSGRDSVGDVIKNFSKLVRLKKKAAVAGRLMSLRSHGGAVFGHLKDGTGKIQAFFKKDILKARFRLLEYMDLGDFLWVSGGLLKTKTGERTIEVREFEVLAKSLRPIPSEWYGLEDVEERFRKRYLDLLINAEVKARFETRSKIISLMRGFLDRAGFMEVDTPVLQPLHGGAAAKPFKAHLDILDIDLYLRIAPELYLKRLLVGGFEKIYEIGRVFRNEGIDREHNPEFTMLELYWTYQNRDGLMKFCEKLIRFIAKSIGSKTELGRTPWPTATFNEVIRRAVGIDYARAGVDELRIAGETRGLRFEAERSKGKIGDEIFKKLFIAKIEKPVFIVDHPVEISPLAKKDPKNPQTALRFQIAAKGWEFANGFAELNDPTEQRERFEAQERIRRAGDEEAMHYDEDFVEALEYGMPPAAGLGMGIDRLVAWLTGAPSLKEAILFPLLKPKK